MRYKIALLAKKEFKTKLYIHSKNYPNDRKNSIHVYTLFRTVTVELLDMLESIEENSLGDFQHCLTNCKQVSDRDAVEKLFYLLNQKTYHPMFTQFLSVLKCLLKSNAIYSLEVHHNLSLIDNVLDEYKSEWFVNEEDIFDL